MQKTELTAEEIQGYKESLREYIKGENYDYYIDAQYLILFNSQGRFVANSDLLEIIKPERFGYFEILEGGIIFITTVKGIKANKHQYYNLFIKSEEVS